MLGTFYREGKILSHNTKGKIKTMKTISLIFACFIVLAGCKKETIVSVDDHLNQLPHGLNIDNRTPQRYQLTEVYFNKNVDGTFSNKEMVTGQYTRGLTGGDVKWNSVYFASAHDSIDQAFPAGTKQEYMDNLIYIPTDSLLTEKSLYKNFPTSFPDKIWDIYGIETVAWLYFDSLKLNVPYRAIQADVRIPILLPDFTGTYYQRDLRITWAGVTRLNSKDCAIIDFIALNNSTEYYLPGLHLQGNEDYWGTVYVSLKDKQIEYAVMNNSTTEVGQITGSSQVVTEQLTREVKVERIN
jgi:hypothetical protein